MKAGMPAAMAAAKGAEPGPRKAGMPAADRQQRTKGMNKKRTWHILILILFVLFIDAYLLYAMVISDNTPPEVVCDSDRITVSVTASDEELMEGVTATDNRDGDLTDSIAIESISAFAGGERIIVYAAVDKKGNVGRAQRVLEYTDYEAPRFGLEAPLRFSIGVSPDLLKHVTASSTLDGDLTANVKYSMNAGLDVMTAGTYEVEYSVADSTGTISHLPVTIELYDPMEERGTVELTDYLVYVEQGGDFDEDDYYEESSVSGSLHIDSDVDTDEEGVYTVDYTVSDGDTAGRSRLIVVVIGD